MKPFEAYITPDDTIEIHFPDERRTVCLDSEEGLAFAFELVEMLRERYPSMLLAVEARFRVINASLFAIMQQRRLSSSLPATEMTTSASSTPASF